MRDVPAELILLTVLLHVAIAGVLVVVGLMVTWPAGPIAGGVVAGLAILDAIGRRRKGGR